MTADDIFRRHRAIGHQVRAFCEVAHCGRGVDRKGARHSTDFPSETADDDLTQRTRASTALAVYFTQHCFTRR
jgi:hypothetical protein